MSMFGMAWFLSVVWLVLMTHITSKIQDDNARDAVQAIMIAMWVAIGVLTAIFL